MPSSGVYTATPEEDCSVILRAQILEEASAFEKSNLNGILSDLWGAKDAIESVTQDLIDLVWWCVLQHCRLSGLNDWRSGRS